MDGRDEWDSDPSVQMTRRVFSGMEEAQEKLLEALMVSQFDKRLRKVREAARVLFDRTWPIVLKEDVTAGINEAAGLYTHCLARALAMTDIEVNGDVLSKNDHFKDLVEEAAS